MSQSVIIIEHRHVPSQFGATKPAATSYVWSAATAENLSGRGRLTKQHSRDVTAPPK
jgi:hypothetical protein